MADLEFKILTVENWREPDPVSACFVRVDGVRAVPVTGGEWVAALLRPQLVAPVPEDVRALFEVARGALAYGYLFYPLYTLGIEQLFRVGEAAIRHASDAAGYSERDRSFSARIDWLAARGALTAAEAGIWHAVRQLRNAASHPERQSIVGGPGDAVTMLSRLADDVNALFASP